VSWRLTQHELRWKNQTDKMGIYSSGTRCYGIDQSNARLDDGVRVNDFDTSRTFGIDSDHAFIPFDTMGTVVHYESRVPTAEWEMMVHLPIIILAREDWSPSQEVLRSNGDHSREFTETRTIHSRMSDDRSTP
jgi:hypothetical protein